jgi:hypothetical protein
MRTKTIKCRPYRQEAAQFESPAEAARSMLGVPLAFTLVGRMSSLALAVWHCVASYADVHPTDSVDWVKPCRLIEKARRQPEIGASFLEYLRISWLAAELRS